MFAQVSPEYDKNAGGGDPTQIGTFHNYLETLRLLIEGAIVLLHTVPCIPFLYRTAEHKQHCALSYEDE